MFTLKLAHVVRRWASPTRKWFRPHCIYSIVDPKSLLSFTLIFLFSQKEKIGGKLMKSGPRTLKLAVETLKM